MRERILSLCLFAILACMFVVPVRVAAAPPAAEQDATLYKRLGGYDALAAVTDDFLGRLSADPQLGRFFK